MSLTDMVGLQERLRTVVQKRLDTASTPGAAVALFVDGRPLLVAGIGFRDVERTAVLDAEAQFYSYSITKTMLAVVLLKLAGQGQMNLDAPIQSYLPDLALETLVTGRQLLNHSGGIPDYGRLQTYHEAIRAAPARPWSAAEFLARTLPNGLTFRPREGWAYSNIGFLILRLLVESVTGKSLSAAMDHYLFAPLGLQQTFVVESLGDAQGLTPAYSSFFTPDDSLRNIVPVYHPGWVSHGVAATTASELGIIFEALFSGRLLQPERLAMMLEPVFVPYPHPLFERPAYGLGLMIDGRASGDLVAGHGGGGPGYSTAAVHFTNTVGKRVTGVALANRDQPDLGLQLVFTMVDVVTDELLKIKDKG